MPELPEMEHYRRMLSARMSGQAITAVDITREKSINVPPDEFRERTVGRRVTQVERRAKHLLFHTDDGQVLLLHLMLGGILYWGPMADKPERTVQVTLSFGDRHLFCIGLRLGYMHLHRLPEAQKLLRKLGPEPLEPVFTETALQAAVRRKKGALKPVLVDQSVISGIGNCYSDEICFYAGIRPDRQISTLSAHDFSLLHRGIRTVLPEAIAFGGYMEMPLDAQDRVTGGYNDRCKVYDRGGEPCFRCGTPIDQSELASRKMFACPQCQH